MEKPRVLVPHSSWRHHHLRKRGASEKSERRRLCLSHREALPWTKDLIRCIPNTTHQQHTKRPQPSTLEDPVTQQPPAFLVRLPPWRREPLPGEGGQARHRRPPSPPPPLAASSGRDRFSEPRTPSAGTQAGRPDRPPRAVCGRRKPKSCHLFPAAEPGAPRPGPLYFFQPAYRNAHIESDNCSAEWV